MYIINIWLVVVIFRSLTCFSGELYGGCHCRSKGDQKY